MKDDQPIIRAVAGRNSPPLPKAGLLIPVHEDFEESVELTSARTVRKLFRCMDVAVGHYRDREIFLAGPALGAPQAVMLLENLAAMGARKVFWFGWCGSISSEACIGDLVIPPRALSEEGTSGHYPLPGVRVQADPGMTSALHQACTELGEPAKEGAIWTTDAPYRETPSKIRRFTSRGAVAVEMELSALFKVSRYRSIGAAALLVVSDELGSGVWKHGFRSERFHRNRALGLRAALEACILEPGQADGPSVAMPPADSPGH